ncbi:MAG TPA: transglycosylase SLT domain-containing protein [Bryobacteraceae bacterium]|nr:transglycosylase SLT domain-containing protein [Bryobacteraceae bacterium]
MRRRSAKAIPVLSLLVFSLSLSSPGSAQTLESAGRAAKTPDARQAALERFAIAHPGSRDGAAALFALAVLDRGDRRHEQAIRRLRAAGPRLPQLADWVAYNLASALFDTGSFDAIEKELAPVWAARPPSPLLGDAAMLDARAYKATGRPADAVRILREYSKEVPQPEGDFLLAECLRATNDLATAAGYYQRIYYGYPNTPEAERSGAELGNLKTALGELYPPPTSEMMLRRADRWARAGNFRVARSEYESIAAAVDGPERDIARVRAGALENAQYNSAAAYSNLSSLSVFGEADAERLYGMVEAARSLERDDYISGALERLARLHGPSRWRMSALISAGNHYLVRNDAARYLPMYRACVESFGEEARADYCHWKLAWNAYIERRPEAREMLREHLVRYPGSGRSSAALYFLGRLAEAAGDNTHAKAYFTEVVARFSNHYYGAQAQERLTDPAVFRAVPASDVAQFLKTIVWPLPRHHGNFEPAAPVKTRLDRARLLTAAGLDDLAERELRFSARVENQPEVVSIQLVQSAEKYELPHRALQLMKSLVPGYLAIPYDDAPAGFWKLLYPMPWRATLVRYSRAHSLDPYIVAGLIRQESEFNPGALSPAKAYGLTQVMPATGRQLLRMSRRRFRASILFNPEVNLRLGTTYLREVLDSYSGRWEMALAAYNAGPTRVKNWQTWADYREPAEFVETIPFTETREYVMAVLRNAVMYRALYEGQPVSSVAETLPTVRQKIAPKKAGTSFKRSPVVKKGSAATKKPAKKRHSAARKKPAASTAKKTR